MRKFLAILILNLSFINISQANDIKNFQIENISVGDSLLDYFSKAEIKKHKFFLAQAKGNTEYTKIHLEKIKNIEMYDRLGATFRTSDQSYTVTTVEGIIWFRDNINSCLKKRDKIIKELSSLFKSQRKNDHGNARAMGKVFD